MKLFKLIPVLAIIGFTSCDSMFPFGNDISKNDIIGEWTPVQSEIDGVVSETTAEHRNDFVRFNEDKSFVCVEGTKTVEGSWYFVRMNSTVNVMSDEDPENCIPWTIETVTDNELVYTVNTDEGDLKKVWMVR